MPADWSRLCHGLFWFVTPSPHWPSAALLVHYDLSMRDVAAVLWPLVPSLLLVTGLRGAWGVIMAALVCPLSSPTLQCVLWMIWSHFLRSGALDLLLCSVSVISFKHCQRHNGPEGWVHLSKVTSWSSIKSSYTNLAQISSSESWPRINLKISTKNL